MQRVCSLCTPIQSPPVGHSASSHFVSEHLIDNHKDTPRINEHVHGLVDTMSKRVLYTSLVPRRSDLEEVRGGTPGTHCSAHSFNFETGIYYVKHLR